ncbi:MAG TPA: hypothetical protein ENN49_09795 [Bacteroidales bacterium]|nr:hypothetical protein [Bacteroidales bacterium]
MHSIQTAIDLYSPKNDLQGLAVAYFYKGQLYNKLHKYDDAIFCFEKCLGNNESFKNLTVSGDCHNGLALAFAQKNSSKRHTTLAIKHWFLTIALP